MRSGAESTGGKIPEENPKSSHKLPKETWSTCFKHMYHSVDGNLIPQLKNTRDVKKKATPADKSKQ